MTTIPRHEDVGVLTARDDLVPSMPGEEVESAAVITPEQERKEARYQKLSAIKSTYAVVENGATSLAKIDKDDSMLKLEKVLGYLKLAAEVVQPTMEHALAPRLEMTQFGAKPRLPKIQLYQRSKQKKHKKPVEDLHKELQTMRENATHYGGPNSEQ
ncbi:unnamed protein product [Heligmosomoides polygyrus]|uniref:Gag-pol polyprotein n=1 Tax=Heligmosomoides polygyrus TaxID=6339 RepID=A0A183FBK0_HELPZ|nr:unnamed protein product [Heligmosomoides polygyrus]